MKVWLVLVAHVCNPSTWNTGIVSSRSFCATCPVVSRGKAIPVLKSVESGEKELHRAPGYTLRSAVRAVSTAGEGLRCDTQLGLVGEESWHRRKQAATGADRRACARVQEAESAGKERAGSTGAARSGCALISHPCSMRAPCRNWT